MTASTREPATSEPRSGDVFGDLLRVLGVESFESILHVVNARVAAGGPPGRYVLNDRGEARFTSYSWPLVAGVDFELDRIERERAAAEATFAAARDDCENGLGDAAFGDETSVTECAAALDHARALEREARRLAPLAEIVALRWRVDEVVAELEAIPKLDRPPDRDRIVVGEYGPPSGRSQHPFRELDQHDIAHKIEMRNASRMNALHDVATVYGMLRDEEASLRERARAWSAEHPALAAAIRERRERECS